MIGGSLICAAWIWFAWKCEPHLLIVLRGSSARCPTL